MEQSYKEKYEQALAKAKEQYNYPCMRSCMGILEEIFPELAESEDEKVRKEIIEEFTNRRNFASFENAKATYDRWLAWLEKQGEHANFRSKIQVGDKVTRNEAGVLVNLSQLKRVAKPREKQGEKKPFDYENANIQQKPADKVEPKFKVGDFIVNDYCMGRVVEITNDAYLLDTEQGIPFSCHSTRLWDVTKDAKDGDVLYINNTMSESIMIYKSFNNGVINKYASYNKFGFEGENYLTLNDGYIVPATKEQRTELFLKMHEAGYEWDAEKKELKKIEENKGNLGGISPNWSEEDKGIIEEVVSYLINYSNIVESKEDADRIEYLIDKIQDICPHQKQAWSEEDETVLNNLIYALVNDRIGNNRDEYVDWLKSLKDRVGCEANCTTTKEWSEEDEKIINGLIDSLTRISLNTRTDSTSPNYTFYKEIDWLKSLRPQNRWKPSDEQMEVLYKASKNEYLKADQYDVLLELWNNLKKLKEE